MKLTFQNAREQCSVTEKFFPHLYFYATPDHLQSIRKALEKMNVRVLFEPISTHWKASVRSEQDLETVSREIEHVTSLTPDVLPIEEQFMVEKGYGIGQSFVDDNDDMIVSNKEELPAFWVEGLDQTLEQTIAEYDANELAWPQWINQIMESRILQTLPENVPIDQEEKTNLFWRHFFFQNQQPFAVRSASEKGKPVWEKESIKDQTRFANQVLQASNISPETMDCACCTPLHLNAPNLLAHSRVEVKNHNDGAYFQSFHPEFALAYQEKNPQQNQSWQFKADWKLPHIPIGPLSRTQTVSVLLPDAKTWEQEGTVTTIGLSQPHWHCVKKQGIIPKAWQALQSRSDHIKKQVRQAEGNGFAKNGISGLWKNEESARIAWLRNELVLQEQLQATFLPSLRENGLLDPLSFQALKAAYWQLGKKKL